MLRPPNYAAPAVVILLAMLVLGLLYMRRNNLEFLYNRTSWGLICLVRRKLNELLIERRAIFSASYLRSCLAKCGTTFVVLLS